MSKTVLGAFFALALVASLCLAMGCVEDRRSDGRPMVVTTTGMIADVASRIAGPHVEVLSLIGPGLDPHTFKPTESDVRKLTTADLILYNGLNLEGTMGDVLRKVGRSRATLAVAETLPSDLLLRSEFSVGHADPHVWFDVSLWRRTIPAVEAALLKLLPSAGEEFRRNAERFEDELETLDKEVSAGIASIPAERRLLVTAHDAFGYFGRRYGIDVVGLQGISTATEAGIQDVRRVVDLVVERRVRAVFVESSVNPDTIESVRQGCQEKGHMVSIGGQLFSDAMGSEGTPEGTYVGMVRHNLATIVNALK
jgi:manganese/zinc/iron transport system substrate-binding protein